VNGDCESDGSCHCNNNFFGIYCDQRCADSKCNISCVCNETTSCSNAELICNNEIIIENQTISFSTNVEFLNAMIGESLVNFTSLSFKILNNLTVSDSNLLFDSSSSITVNGCINLNNISLSLTISNSSSNQKIVLLNSSSGCLNISNYFLNITNIPKCTILKNETTSSSFTILLAPDVKCATVQSPFQWYIVVIIVGSVFGVLIILTLIVFLIPSIRHKIFVRTGIRNQVKNKSRVIGNMIDSEAQKDL